MRVENRKSPRIQKPLDGTVERVASVLQRGEQREVHVRVLDVSREGASFASPQPFDKGAFIRLKLDINAASSGGGRGKWFVTSAVVRDSVYREDGTFHVGVKIREQTGRELETWNDLISRWSQKLM